MAAEAAVAADTVGAAETAVAAETVVTVTAETVVTVTAEAAVAVETVMASVAVEFFVAAGSWEKKEIICLFFNPFCRSILS